MQVSTALEVKYVIIKKLLDKFIDWASIALGLM